MSRRIAILAGIAGVFIATAPAFAVDRNVTTVRPSDAPASAPPASGVTLVGPPALYADDGVMLAYPNFYPDPAWKLCQIGPTSHRDRYFYCGPYSYHPYGSLGYRPLGTYRPYRAAPIVMQVPSAKIINVTGD